MTKLFISNSVRIFYLYVLGVGPLNSLFCPGGGILYTMIVPGGKGFALFESCPWGLSRGRGMVLDEIDSCINGLLLSSPLTFLEWPEAKSSGVVAKYEFITLSSCSVSQMSQSRLVSKTLSYALTIDLSSFGFVKKSLTVFCRSTNSFLVQY